MALSRLESLPIELLEEIFWFCLNLSLPRASRHLGAALSSRRLKEDLVLRVFPVTGYDTCNLHYIDRIRIKSQHTNFSEAGPLQSDILNCRWMTWDLLRSCMEKFITQMILRVFKSQKLHWRDNKPVQDASIKAFVHEVLHLEDDCKEELQLDHDQLTTHEEWDQWREDSENETKAVRESMEKLNTNEVAQDFREEPESQAAEPDNSSSENEEDSHWLPIILQGSELGRDRNTIVTRSFFMKHWKCNGSGDEIAVGITRRAGIVIIGSRLPAEGEDSDSSGRWSCLKPATRIDANGFSVSAMFLPHRLLRGPWTEDKLNLLEAVLEAPGSYPERDAQRKYVKGLASQGLMDAIREENYRAVDMIASVTIDAQFRDPRNPTGVYVEPSFREASLYFQKHGPLGEPSLLGLKERRTLDVAPTLEHLKAAVEHGCWRMIVRRLLFARRSPGEKLIDFSDPAVTAWIEERASQGDEKGQWLQYQHAKVSRLRSQTDNYFPKKDADVDEDRWSTTSSSSEDDLDRYIDYNCDEDLDGQVDFDSDEYLDSDADSYGDL